MSWYGFLGTLLRALRSPQESVKQPAINCRLWSNNGDVVVCDEKIEVRQESIDALSEARDNLSPVLCDPEDPRCFEENFEDDFGEK